MLIYFVFFVSLNIVMIRSQDKTVDIYIKKNEVGQKTCNVSKGVTLVAHSNFTLHITSEYFIKSGVWFKIKHGQSNESKKIEHLNDSELNMTYLRTIGSDGHHKTNTTIYTFTHDRKTPLHPATWIFTFEVIENYDPWSFESPKDKDIQTWKCSTEVNIDRTSSDHSNHGKQGTNGSLEDRSLGGKGHADEKLLLIILLSVIGALLFAQSTYIIWGKVKDRKLNKNSDKDPIAPKSPNVKRGSNAERNIADRPPLPLPTDEVIGEEPVPPLPLSPVSPGPKRHLHYPTAPPMPMIQALNSYQCQPGPIPPNSYRNKGLDTSEEGITSPASARRHKETNLAYEEIRSPELSRRYMEGPLVPKPLYKNNALEKSVEELRSPDFPRRHEGPLVPKPLYKNNALEKSVEELRSPDFPRRHEGPLVPKPSYKNNVIGNSEELRSHDFAGRQPGSLVPKKSFRNKELDNSVEQLRSPEFGRRHEGPLVPKQSYNRKPAGDSDEEMGTPHFARRQIEAKMAQLPPKGVMPSLSFKQPRPLPRRTSSPPPPPEKPAFHPAHRLGDAHSSELEEALRRRNNDPGPPLLPKKAVLFATPDACRPQDSRRFSDEEWQYETLQPDSKYLNELSNNAPYL